MAEGLAKRHGTEKDRVNCPFYFKVGACRHGDRCSRLHTKPSSSPTILLSNIYQRPDMITTGVDAQGQPIDPHKMQEHFEDFYEDLFEELNKYGEIESLNVCDNLADHMVGNVYVQFRDEEHASKALKNLTGRYYAGRPIIVDFSLVTDFREATCRQYDENTCKFGGYCNFMHLKSIGRELRRQLFGRYRRSRSPYSHHSHDERGSRRHRMHDDKDYYYESQSWRLRSNSPGRTRGRRGRSSGSRRSRSSSRDGSEERRARIEQWNREREEAELASKAKANVANNKYTQNEEQYRHQEPQEQRGYEYSIDSGGVQVFSSDRACEKFHPILWVFVYVCLCVRICNITLEYDFVISYNLQCPFHIEQPPLLKLHDRSTDCEHIPEKFVSSRMFTFSHDIPQILVFL